MSTQMENANEESKTNGSPDDKIQAKQGEQLHDAEKRRENL